MTSENNLSRRKFLGAAAGVAGVAAVGSAIPGALSSATAAAGSAATGERLVPPGKLGIQHFSIRDSITRRSIANSLANLSYQDANIDNMEGLAVRRGPKGETLLYMISDNNFSPFQRTVLLMFELRR